MRVCTLGGRLRVGRRINHLRARPDSQFFKVSVMPKGKTLSLLSGGLDSILAARILMAQGIEVLGLHFITPFFGYHKKDRESHHEEQVRQLYDIRSRIIDVSEEYIDVLRTPRYGYGSHFNPCIDCKIFFLRKAKEMMEEERADFLTTGEVLGQRPMSQRRDALRIIERDSGTEGILLRPLSAKILKPTRPELEGLVDREKLFGLSGRGRKPQMKLAAEMGIRQYPQPAGGCLLTDPVMGGRIRKFFSRSQRISVNDLLLLQVGRHFHLPGNQHLIVGRTEAENERLTQIAGEAPLFLRVAGIPGPLGLIRGKVGDNLHLASSIVARYSKAGGQEKVEVLYGETFETQSGQVTVTPARDGDLQNLRY
jgi:tRNA-specific 2-thiouridylase